MLRNYLKITLRQLWRNRLFTGLNIFGLSIGLAACWIIFQMGCRKSKLSSHQSGLDESCGEFENRVETQYLVSLGETVKRIKQVKGKAVKCLYPIFFILST